MVAFVYSYTNINREELTISCEKSSKNHTGTHSRVHFKIWPCEELTHKSQTHTEMEFLKGSTFYAQKVVHQSGCCHLC